MSPEPSASLSAKPEPPASPQFPQYAPKPVLQPEIASETTIDLASKPSPDFIDLTGDDDEDDDNRDDAVLIVY